MATASRIWPIGVGERLRWYRRPRSEFSAPPGQFWRGLGNRRARAGCVMAANRTAEPGAPLRVLGYTRVSTEEQGRSGAGLAAQRAAILQACERHGHHLLEITEDSGFSAKSLDRP